MRITPIGLAPPQLPQEQTERALGQPPAARAGAAMAGWSGVDAALAVQRRIDDIKEDPDDPDALRKACQGYGTVLAPRAEAHGNSEDWESRPVQAAPRSTPTSERVEDVDAEAQQGEGEGRDEAESRRASQLRIPAFSSSMRSCRKD